MATITHIHSAAPRAEKRGGFFQAFSAGMIAYMERRSRSDKIAALQAKSDAELTKLGITRDQIPAYVFRDLFYV